jgi:subtilase family serine protease
MNFNFYSKLFALIFLITMSCLSATEWVEMETSSRQKFVGFEPAFGSEANKNELHTVSFHLKGRNNDVLEQKLSEISDPKHPNYGKHLTRDEIRALTTDQEGAAKILSYVDSLRSHTENPESIKVVKQQDSAISVEASIGTWEQAFNTVFYQVTIPSTRPGDAENDGQRVILRSKTYSLPSDLAQHVSMVEGTTQIPVEMHKKPIISHRVHH